MGYLIERVENYITLTPETTEKPLSDFPSKSRYYEDGVNIVFETSQDRSEDIILQKSDIKQSNGTPFADEAALKTWLRANTGFSSGAGGSASELSGFMDYNDTTGSISLTANTWTDIPNNGLGAFTNKTYKPDGVTELMDVATGYIDPTELNLGEAILIRNDYTINPNTNNALLQFRYELGTGAGTYTLEKNVGRLDSGSGQDYRFSLEPDLIYMGDTNTRDNSIKLQVKLSSNGTLTNAGSVIQLIKR